MASTPYVRSTVVLVTAALLSSAATAQTPADTELNPGIVPADSPLYGVDVAIDEFLVDQGVKPPGPVVFERASESAAAAAANNTAALDRALNDMQRVAQVANGMENGSGLAKAEAVLQAVKAQAPDQAQQGLQQAIDSIITAKNRDIDDTVPEHVPDQLPGQAPVDTGGGTAAAVAGVSA
jgi:hypothetical protein